MTVREAIKEATKYAEEKSEDKGENRVKVTVTHKTQFSSWKNMKLFDNLNFGERRDLDEGELCKLDGMRADVVNINLNEWRSPFIFKQHNQFSNILDKVVLLQ